MKFEELTTQHQEFLMYCLFDHIKRKVKEEERDQVIEPTYEEDSSVASSLARVPGTFAD